MASLLIWGPVLAHKSVISHRREKQRIKNYQRWEGLRDEYDEQRKVGRETRSLDLQRTGTWDGQQFTPSPPTDFEEERRFITLRDQQEGNDARTGWRPQECWEGPKTQLQAQMTGQVQQIQQPQMPIQRHVSMTPAMTPQMTGQSTASLPLRSQKTGATWDDGLPTRLAVSRQSFDDYDHTSRYRSNNTQSMPVSREPSLNRQPSMTRQDTYDQSNGLNRQNSITRTNTNLSRQASLSRTQTPSGLRESTPAPLEAEIQQVPMQYVERYQSYPETQVTSVVEMPKNEFGFVEPARAFAGGRMAELIERGY